jgi:anti-sigma28 factor (negative regulator of flagellin synthesis)
MNEEGNYIAFDPEEGDEWELNETGALIVKGLIDGASLEEIKKKITGEYTIDAETAEEALTVYIEELKKAGIILDD